MNVYRFLALIALLYSQNIFGQNSGYELSLSQYNNGNEAEALRTINEYIASNSKNSDAYILRAFYYLRSDQKGLAFEDYNDALELDPLNENGLTNRAMLLMEMEDYNAALIDLNQLVLLAPNNWSYYYERGYCKGLNGDHAGAIEDFTIAININPDNGSTYTQRGYVRINLIKRNGSLAPTLPETSEACRDFHLGKTKGDSDAQLAIDQYCTK